MTFDALPRLSAALADRYTIERELGGGGMSRVFLAEEIALGRQVVIKLLAPELAEGLSADRFTREIRLAARLQHPNIVPLLGAGTADGLPWYTMPFVRGDSLRARLDAGALDRSVALRVIADIARALAYAHAAGVVHRDIKPENVLISEGVAVVTDFGIARALSAAHTTADHTRLTQLGSALGTPAYMAPEQAVGDANIDQRADLYSLGVLAYELLAGRHPLADKRGAQQLIVAHLTQMPAALDTMVADLPPSVGAIVMECLAKEAASRPESALAILTAIESVPQRSASTDSGRTGPSIELSAGVAVLPFVNLTSDPENEYLSDGITDEVLGTLGRSRTIRVAGRASCFALKGQRLDPQTVGAKLNVTSVVEGSVRRMGDRVRVSAELLNVADGFQVWSERYDRDVTDVFALQDEIAQAVAQALTGRLTTPAVPAVQPAAPVNGEAYRLYLLAMHLILNQFTYETNEHALGLVEESLALDQSFARAHLARALIFQFRTMRGFGVPRSMMAESRRSARAALALDDLLAQAWTMEAQACYLLDGSWEQAAACYERALRVSPDDAITLVRVSNFLAIRGEGDRAAAMCRRAVRIDPLSGMVSGPAANTLRHLRHHAEAIAMCRTALELNPHHITVLITLARALGHVGETAEALEIAKRGVAVAPRLPNAVSALCVARAGAGEIEPARALLRELAGWHAPEHPIAVFVAFGYAGMGEVDEALRWFATAEEAGEYWLPWVATDPIVDPLRNDPRFQAMAKRLGVSSHTQGVAAS